MQALVWTRSPVFGVGDTQMTLAKLFGFVGVCQTPYYQTSHYAFLQACSYSQYSCFKSLIVRPYSTVILVLK